MRDKESPSPRYLVGEPRARTISVPPTYVGLNDGIWRTPAAKLSVPKSGGKHQTASITATNVPKGSKTNVVNDRNTSMMGSEVHYSVIDRR